MVGRPSCEGFGLGIAVVFVSGETIKFEPWCSGALLMVHNTEGR